MYHSIKDELQYKILLAKQWIERITLEHRLLLDAIDATVVAWDIYDNFSAAENLTTWQTRLNEDLGIVKSRLEEDGYTHECNSYFEGDLASFQDGYEYAIVPIVKNGHADVEIAEIWRRKAAQS